MPQREVEGDDVLWGGKSQWRVSLGYTEAAVFHGETEEQG